MHCLGSQRHPTGCLTTKPLPKKGPWASGNLRAFGGHWYAKTLELPLLKTVVIRFRYHLCLEKYATRWSVLSTESSLKSKTRESVNNWQKNTLPKTYINPKLMVGYMFLRLLLEQCSFPILIFGVCMTEWHDLVKSWTWQECTPRENSPLCTTNFERRVVISPRWEYDLPQPWKGGSLYYQSKIMV